MSITMSTNKDETTKSRTFTLRINPDFFAEVVEVYTHCQKLAQ